MPYIKHNRRKIFNKYLEGILNREDIVKGDLTYCIYKLGVEYLKSHETNYQNLSDIISAMNDSAEEFRRRKLNPYEDKKIMENWDIK